MKHFRIILFLLLITACQESNKERITRLVTEWQGKEIVFPENIVFTRFITDTTDWQIPKSDYKVLIYVDSIGCTSCKLQLDKWQEMITYADSLSGGTVPFLFFFHATDYKEIGYLLKRDQFDLPVCIDKEDQLNKLNKFPSDITFQTFLLDKSNKVVTLGNPVHNLAVKDLYSKQISGHQLPTTLPLKTIAQAEENEINLGYFDQEETKTTVFHIKNIGKAPLVIIDVATTCGCVTATFDKNPAKPGGILQVHVKMTPKESGFFDETLTVKCNIDNFIKLKIKGHAQ